MSGYDEIHRARGWMPREPRVPFTIEFSENELRVLAYGASYTFADARGHRWFGPGGWVKREWVEEEFNLPAGSIDALETFWHHATEAMHDERRAFQKRWMEFHEEVDRLTHQVYRIMAEAEREAFAGRHAKLAAWRSQGKKPAGVPDSLQGIRHVKRLDPDLPCVVYFLLQDDEVVYVGQTRTTWPNRIEDHARDEGKQFNDVWYLEVDRWSVNEVEAEYIRRFRPKYNKTHNRGDREQIEVEVL